MKAFQTARREYILLLVTFLMIDGISSYCTPGVDGLSFDCESEFAGESTSFSIKVKSCRDPPKVKVSMTVAALGVNYNEEFDTSQDIPIPGFSVAGVGIHLHVEMDSQSDGSLSLKLQLAVKDVVQITKVTVLDKTISKSNCNEAVTQIMADDYDNLDGIGGSDESTNWWNSQSDGMKSGVGIAIIVVLIASCVCCCRYCCCRNERQPTIIMAPPSTGGGNTTVVNTSNMMHMPAPHYPGSSHIPYEKQVNYPM